MTRKNQGIIAALVVIIAVGLYYYLRPPVEEKPTEIKIGFVTTLSTGAGAIGRDMRDSVNIALDQLGHKMAGIPVRVLFEDDGFKPEIGKQKTEKLVNRDKVDFMSGYIWSHVLLASRKTVLDAGIFLIVSNAGTSKIAGKLCNRNLFSTSWQNDQIPMALGEVLNRRGVKSLYIVAPNYTAGKDMANGVERTFKGKILGRDMTKWPAQKDFSAELAKIRSAGPEGVFIFYPGPHTDAFIRQYQQAGLSKIPLYSVFSVDSMSLRRLQKAKVSGVLGTFTTGFWSPDLDTVGNKRFVADFKKKHGKYPSHYGAQSYDSIMLINSAVEAVGGNIKDMDGLRAAFKKADFDSVRGRYKYNTNNFPIQNFYLREVVTDSDGVWTTRTAGVIYRNHKDPFYKECEMK